MILYKSPFVNSKTKYFCALGGVGNLPEREIKQTFFRKTKIKKHSSYEKINIKCKLSFAKLKVFGTFGEKMLPGNSEDDIKNAMEIALGKKFDAKPELRELNYKALEMGMAMIEKVGA